MYDSDNFFFLEYYFFSNQICIPPLKIRLVTCTLDVRQGFAPVTSPQCLSGSVIVVAIHWAVALVPSAVPVFFIFACMKTFSSHIKYLSSMVLSFSFGGKRSPRNGKNFAQRSITSKWPRIFETQKVELRNGVLAHLITSQLKQLCVDQASGQLWSQPPVHIFCFFIILVYSYFSHLFVRGSSYWDEFFVSYCH